MTHTTRKAAAAERAIRSFRPELNFDDPDEMAYQANVCNSIICTSTDPSEVHHFTILKLGFERLRDAARA